MKFKKITAVILSIVLACGMAMPASAAEKTDGNVIVYPDPAIKENLPAEKPDVSEDLYLNINYDSIKENDIPEGRCDYSIMSALAENVYYDVIAVLTDENAVAEADAETKLVFDYYNMFLDMDKRNSDGWKSVTPILDKLDAVQSLEEFYDLIFTDPVYLTVSGFYYADVFPDDKDSQSYILTYSPHNLTIPDSAEYEKMTEFGELYKGAYTALFKKLLLKYGFDEKKASEYIDKFYSFETKLAQNIYDLETTYRDDYFDMIYNVYTEEEVVKLCGSFPIAEMMNSDETAGQKKYNITQPEYFQGLADIVCENNIEEIKAWMMLDILFFAAEYSDEESFEAFKEYENTVNGITGSLSNERIAYDYVSMMCPELVGYVYVNAYFTEEVKKDVEKIVYDLIDVYRRKLEKNDWLSKETKDTAIEKLDSISVFVVCPDGFEFDYSGIVYDPDKDLFTNCSSYWDELLSQKIANIEKPVDKTKWGNEMSPHIVNAAYMPSTNSVFFPAAILNAPFYDKDASYASNMGGIGSVIGHEISHAFDTFGSQFDKDGNRVNWWNEDDKKAFDERTKAVAERYSLYQTIDEMNVNGDLVIGEAIADLSGTAAALEVLEKNTDGTPDYKEFFEANARSWFRMLTKENATQRLKMDPHPPTSLRVNVNSSQQDQFYEAFDIKEGDAMYTAPEDRLKIW